MIICSSNSIFDTHDKERHELAKRFHLKDIKNIMRMYTEELIDISNEDDVRLSSFGMYIPEGHSHVNFYFIIEKDSCYTIKCFDTMDEALSDVFSTDIKSECYNFIKKYL